MTLLRAQICLLSLALFFSSALAQALPAQVLLIRHGEKPADEGRELSDRGWERARALPKLFHERPEFALYGSPVALVGMAPKKKKKGSIRAIQTLKYVAEDLHLTVNSDFTDAEVAEMVKYVRETPAHDGKLVVICWNHDSMRDIAKEFGVKKAPKLSGDIYDRAWLLTFQQQGSVSFQDLPEKLLSGDSEQ